MASAPAASTLLVTGDRLRSLYVVPFVAYPPNPPAVGQGETIGLRTALYFTLLAISVIAAITAVLVGRRLAARWGAWYAGLAVVGGYLVVVVIAIAVLPTYDEVPAEFPAAVLYEFRTASFLTQLTLVDRARGRAGRADRLGPPPARSANRARTPTPRPSRPHDHPAVRGMRPNRPANGWPRWPPRPEPWAGSMIWPPGWRPARAPARRDRWTGCARSSWPVIMASRSIRSRPIRAR